MRQFWIASILLSTALGSSAITLGRHSGAGVLGRALDIRVQALLAPGEEVGDICVSADVLYGETKLSPGAVRATLQRATPDAQASLRIQASVPINEPVVTVLVRAGCTAPFTRRYVLLADPVSESAPPVSTAAVGGVSGAPRESTAGPLPPVSAPAGIGLPEPTARGSNSGAAAATGATEASRAAAQQPARAKPPATSAANQASRRVQKPASTQPVPPTAPRLELDAIDLSSAIERDPALKLSPSLLSEPVGSPEARAAAGRLWQAINASPEDVLRDAGRLEALRAEVSALREAQAGNQAAINELTSRLEQSQKGPWWLVVLGVLLVLVLALALLAGVWLWRQQKMGSRFAGDKAWWAKEEALNSAEGGSVQPGPAAASSVPLDIDLTLAPDVGPSTPRSLSGSVERDDKRPRGGDSIPPLPEADRAEFVSSQLASRSVATEELFDVQQQADFFISLGEDEQAIAVLRDHIAESQVPSALAYLDLLKIYHRQGRADDYQRLRTDFNALFNAGAPAFDQFSDEGRGLESYERALGRIQALWPQPRVLDVIERSIFREPGDPRAEVFDLEAYRELLLLYAMAKEMIEREAVDSGFSQDFASTTAQALKATARRSAMPSFDRSLEDSTRPTEEQTPALSNPGLDVNLDDLAEFAAFEASLPDIDLSVEPTVQVVRRHNVADPSSNLIDFELLDFTPPGESLPPAEPSDDKR